MSTVLTWETVTFENHFLFLPILPFDMEKYAFLYVIRSSPTSEYTVRYCSNKLYETMLEAIHGGVNFSTDEIKNPLYDTKIAYFKILTNKIIKELHSVKRRCRLQHSVSDSGLWLKIGSWFYHWSINLLVDNDENSINLKAIKYHLCVCVWYLQSSTNFKETDDKNIIVQYQVTDGKPLSCLSRHLESLALLKVIKLCVVMTSKTKKICFQDVTELWARRQTNWGVMNRC